MLDSKIFALSLNADRDAPLKGGGVSAWFFKILSPLALIFFLIIFVCYKERGLKVNLAFRAKSNSAYSGPESACL